MNFFEWTNYGLELHIRSMDYKIFGDMNDWIGFKRTKLWTIWRKKGWSWSGSEHPWWPLLPAREGVSAIAPKNNFYKKLNFQRIENFE